MDILAALCDILSCTPNDLIEIDVVNEQTRRTAQAGQNPSAPPVRRTTIRRPADS
jgi:hypothetical protein